MKRKEEYKTKIDRRVSIEFSGSHLFLLLLVTLVGLLMHCLSFRILVLLCPQ